MNLSSPAASDNEETCSTETNRVVLVGTVAALSERRQERRAVTTVLVLVTRRWTARNGLPRESTDAITMTANWPMDNVPPVGSQVRVDARLHGIAFQGRDGVTKHVVDVVINQITAVPAGDGNQPPAPAAGRTEHGSESCS